MSLIGKARERYGEDYELNIVPVLDSLVVLISFLLLSATFANVVLLDATIPTVLVKAIEKSHNERDQFKLEVTVTNKDLLLNIEGNKSAIANIGGTYDLKKLHQALVAVKRQFPERFSVDLNVEADIPYGSITKIMDEMRNLWPEDGTITTENQKHTLLFPDIVLTGLGN